MIGAVSKALYKFLLTFLQTTLNSIDFPSIGLYVDTYALKKKKISSYAAFLWFLDGC
jgi:hypothetical protein